jgi:hypothetical protein
LEEYSIANHVQEYVLEPSPPVLIIVNDPIIPGYVHRHTFSDRALCKLSDVDFFPDTGHVFIGNQLVRESDSYASKSTVKNSKAFYRDWGRPIIGIGPSTHYHWLIETLPRVIAAHEFCPQALIVASDRLTANQRQSLEVIKAEVYFTDIPFACDELVMATYGNDSGWPHPLDLELLRKTLGVPSEPGTSKIFLTRINASRSDSLSHEIHALFSDSGWSMIEAEKLSWQEQLDIFGNAAVIAGEHGAGLSNIAVAPPQTRLIELVRSNYANPCFAALSHTLNGNLLNYSAHRRELYRTVLSFES